MSEEAKLIELLKAKYPDIGERLTKHINGLQPDEVELEDLIYIEAKLKELDDLLNLFEFGIKTNA